MTTTAIPIELFGAQQLDGGIAPRVFFSAHRYVQGPGVLRKLSDYLPLVGSQRPMLLIPRDLPPALTSQVAADLEAGGVRVLVQPFEGQCSVTAIEQHAVRAREAGCDAVIALGGGKAIDTAKSVGFQLGLPVIVCPTLASSDAPCSALAIVYSDEGTFESVRFFRGNPDLVVVDTAVIAQAPVRFLLAGIADALATGYEAAACVANPKARSMLGGGISLAARALASLCSQTIHEQAREAVQSVREKRVGPALEDVVEANTLLSGTGFESAGTAAAHAVATALTVVPEVEHRFMHGELVAVGLVTQLLLEGNEVEFNRVQTLFREIGLPYCFADLGLNLADSETKIRTVVENAFNLPFIHNEPFEVTPDKLFKAITEVERRAGKA
ncbi:glycerol dehydrogenase [uncultured Nevskia sp.]|uniref:glycerol dehydrogenase n=1 Tax=uncultured Nevskia sp. TaxID=228950 RepID=UPI0025FCBAA0|nr:glycerol dehydrogenase [uncultured Nevskia sp.]